VKSQPPLFKERSFGVSVGAVMATIGAVLIWRGQTRGGGIAAAVGVLLMAAGYLRPAVLKWPAAAWWRMAAALGYVNARILLTAAFALLLTPMGLVWRMIGRDPLGHHRERWPGWTARPPRYAARDHYRRMF
jgi:hypothetical protein